MSDSREKYGKARERFSKLIRETIRKLRKECHREDCRLIDQCPKDPSHDERCSELLNTSTALKWAAADEIQCLNYLVTWNPPDIAVLKRGKTYAEYGLTVLERVARHHDPKVKSVLGTIVAKLCALDQYAEEVVEEERRKARKKQ